MFCTLSKEICAVQFHYNKLGVYHLLLRIFPRTQWYVSFQFAFLLGQELLSQPSKFCWTFHSQAGLKETERILTTCSNRFAEWEVLYIQLTPSEIYLNFASSQTEFYNLFSILVTSLVLQRPEVLQDGLQPSPVSCKIKPRNSTNKIRSAVCDGLDMLTRVSVFLLPEWKRNQTTWHYHVQFVKRIKQTTGCEEKFCTHTHMVRVNWDPPQSPLQWGCTA